jgi:hypothetical protein
MCAAEVPDLLKNVHLASFLPEGGVLIRSNYGYDGPIDRLLPVQGSKAIFSMPPPYRAQFLSEHAANWQAGDRWQVYPGAGKPATVLIQETGLVISGHGSYVSAIARFENADDANRIAGLRASEFLAMPGLADPGVSEQPLMAPSIDDDQANRKIEKLLFERARTLVASEEWKGNMAARLGPRPYPDDAQKRDKAFLEKTNSFGSLHLSRWSLPGRNSLLFAEIVWTSNEGTSLFGANAVIEDGDVPSILDFDTRPGEQMRAGTEQADTWSNYSTVFLNAWAIGSRRFVLKYTRYYEGYGIDLMEIVPGKGLVETGIGYGDGA